MRKKLLSLLLAALMILGLLPAAALAAEGDTAPAASAAEDIAVQADEETVTLPVEADDSGSDNAITVTVDGTAYEVKNTGTVTADSKAAPIYKVVVPNGTAAVTVNWGLLVTRGAVACPCGACTVSLNDLKASNGTFALPLSDHSAEETAAVTKGYFASAEALQSIKDQSYQKMVFAWMRCKDADGNWCYALLCVEIEGVTNSAPALASGVALYTVVAPDGETYTADVTKFFVDEDAGDTLAYYVSVNGGEFTKLEKPEAYTYTYGENFVNARLTFKANDGKADSLQNCTVILNNPEYPVVHGADSSTTNTTTGTAVQLSIGSLISHPQSISLNYFVSIDGGEYKQVTLSSNKYTYAPTKAGTHTLLFKASTAKTLEDGKTSGVYTWTVTATGPDINNHAPIVKNPTEGPGQLGSGVNVAYWKPDLASIFSDPDGDTLTYSYSIDGSDFSEYYPTVGIHADYLKPDGTHTVTIRATDPYGEYAEFTVTIEKSTNHLPTKKADAPGKLSVFVPVGLTYTVDANLYYEDVDAKDQGKLRFLNNRFQSAGSYTASTVGDTKTETAYGADSVDRSVDGIEITYTAIAIDEENASITNGETYSLNLAKLNFPGNYKVRINGGAEQDAAESYTFTPSEPGKYYLHFYGSQTKTAEQNYVVKLTVLPNGTEPAPMTVTIGETGYEVRLVTTVDSEGTDYNVYKTVVPKDFDNLTITLKNAVTVDEIYCADYSAKKTSSITIPNHEGCEDIACELGVNVADYIDTTKYGMINVITADTSLHFLLLIQVGEPKPNTPPTLAEGVEESVNKYGFEDIAWELDLSTIFTDADGDALTYKVSVNGADPVEAAEKYSYVCGTTSVTLKFTANDGKADSDKTYTVTLYSNRKTIQLKESGESEVATGTVFSLSMYSIFKDPSATGKSFYYSINGAEKEFLGSGQTNRVAFKRAFEKPGTYKLEFYAQHGPTFIGPYTHTLTVTGEEVTNHKPYLLETADAQKPTGDFWVGDSEPHWRPDLTKVFADEDGYDTLSFTYKDDLDERFSTFYTGPYQPGYTASKYKVGERTVTIRATDPYGAYVDYTAQFTVKQDHPPVRKAGVQDAYTFEVPFGATLTLKAGDYFEDTDEKDINTEMQFFSPRSTTYTYKADGSAERVVTMRGCCDGYASIAKTDSVTFTFRTVMPESWPTITDFTVSSMHGVANSDTGAEEGDVAVKAVTVTPYDTLRVANGEAAAGLITIRMDEDVIAAARESYELSAGKATATASTGASVGVELDDDIFLQMADNYRIAHAVSVSQKIQNETYGEYTLTTCYDLMLIGSNARPILAVENAAVTEKVTQDVAWTIDLNGLFSDADGDLLTYKVSVNGAEAAAIEGSTYTYTPADGIHTLVFTANDGKVGSTDTYTVTLLTRRPNAPAWPQVLEYSIERVQTYSDEKEDIVYFPVAKTDLVQYDALVTENSKTYVGEIVLYVTDADFASRNWYATDKGAATVKITNGATTTAANAITIRKSSGAFVSSYDVKVTEDGQTYYYYMKAVQAETPAFEPAIGNGTAAGTTENNVTTFPAGTNASAPTVTVTAPARGWAAGENTFTVACDKACVVLVKSGETYTKLTAANSGETHSFTANLAEGDEIIVRLKGDVNGDGVINTTDAGMAKAASLNKGSLSGLNLICAMVSGGTTVKTTDAGQIKAASLNKLTFNW